MAKNLTDWETLERDAIRGFEILGCPMVSGWAVEVRFDNEEPPRQPDAGRTPATREEAITVGREMAKMG